MGLFDNIFLDKDTPTALLENPEIKTPETNKKVEAEVPYDPKNDPIAPAVEDKKEDTQAQETNPDDVSFDIGGDLDFSNIGETSTEETKTPEVGEATSLASTLDNSFAVNSETETTTNEATSTDTGMSSIAMIQGGMASIVDGIDIGGETKATEDCTCSINTPEATGTPEIHIEIHDIEDHQVGDASLLGNGDGGIYGFMGDSTPTETEIPKIETTTEPEVNVEEKKEEGIFVDTHNGIDAFGESSILGEGTQAESTVIESTQAIEIPQVKSGRGGKIQELITKLISELRNIDEEEEKAEKERNAKIQDITKREQELEREYNTRREALKYERASLELPIDKTAEKERINALIASFQEDIA